MTAQPLCLYGTLKDLLIQADRDHCGFPFRAQSTLLLLRQIGEALTFLHNMGVLHTDLQPNNVAVKAVDQTNTPEHLVLIDLDNARILTDHCDLADCRPGLAKYQAPECYTKGPVFGPKSDDWVLGALCWCALTGLDFPPGLAKGEITPKNQPFGNDSLDEIWTQVSRLLAYPPASRASSEETLHWSHKSTTALLSSIYENLPAYTGNFAADLPVLIRSTAAEVELPMLYKFNEAPSLVKKKPKISKKLVLQNMFPAM